MAGNTDFVSHADDNTICGNNNSIHKRIFSSWNHRKDFLNAFLTIESKVNAGKCHSIVRANDSIEIKVEESVIEHTLCEKYPNTEFFLVRMWENTDQKKLRIWTLCTQ